MGTAGDPTEYVGVAPDSLPDGPRKLEAPRNGVHHSPGHSLATEWRVPRRDGSDCYDRSTAVCAFATSMGFPEPPPRPGLSGATSPIRVMACYHDGMGRKTTTVRFA